MKIIVDADSCPVDLRRIISRAAARVRVQAVFVAAGSIALPHSPHVRLELVQPGENAADKKMLEIVQKGDIAITRDRLLARSLGQRGCQVISDRGERLSLENLPITSIAYLSHEREFRTGPDSKKAFTNKDKHQFASALDRELIRN